MSVPEPRQGEPAYRLYRESRDARVQLVWRAVRRLRRQISHALYWTDGQIVACLQGRLSRPQLLQLCRQSFLESAVPDEVETRPYLHLQPLFHYSGIRWLFWPSVGVSSTQAATVAGSGTTSSTQAVTIAGSAVASGSRGVAYETGSVSGVSGTSAAAHDAGVGAGAWDTAWDASWRVEDVIHSGLSTVIGGGPDTTSGGENAAGSARSAWGARATDAGGARAEVAAFLTFSREAGVPTLP